MIKTMTRPGFVFAIGVLLLLVGNNVATSWPIKDRILVQGNDTIFPAIAGYVPTSSVINENFLDLDQREMNSQLELANNQGVGFAGLVYELGGHSQPFARITLSPALSSNVNSGTQVDGLDVSGNMISGRVRSSTGQGSEAIEILYDALNAQGQLSFCRVGGLEGEAVDFTGCFVSPGIISIADYGDANYTYDRAVDNKNQLTLQSLSTAAGSRFYSCSNCPYPEMDKFVDYYGGATDYANQMITASFNSSIFSPAFVDFSQGIGLQSELRTEFIRVATVSMSFWMFVIGELREAVNGCQPGCFMCPSTQNWDAAVAYYTGSLVGTSAGSTQQGSLLYTLANTLCAEFQTCGPGNNSTVGNSYFNVRLFELFETGKSYLSMGNCGAVKITLNKISNLMPVLLVQATLRSAYTTSIPADRISKALGEAAAYAASVLPLVDSCNSADAQVILDNMKVGSISTNFQAVKEALERNYACMGINCAEVGGYTDATTTQYFSGAAPCEDLPKAIAGYTPTVSVTDQASIDLDQDAIEAYVDAQTSNGFANAEQVYSKGGFSRPFATLQLNEILPRTVNRGTQVNGINSRDELIVGTVLNDAFVGSMTIGVDYESLDCLVGGLQSQSINMNGCFVANGVIEIAGFGAVGYTYDATVGNRNGRTLKDFSANAASTMLNCEDCPYPDFLKFYNYYAMADYGDAWITAGFSGRETNFTNGNANFFSDVGVGIGYRIVTVTRGIVLMNTWMYVIRELEVAVSRCTAGCADCNGPALQYWDQAVATYTGSLVGTEANTVQSGKLLYSVANELCKAFRTCGPDGTSTDGNSHVNRRIFDFFNEGKAQLTVGNCPVVRIIKNKLSILMAIPLVQGALRSAHITGIQADRTPTHLAEGAVYAASVLPIVYACSTEDARTIYRNMGVGALFTTFTDVKTAFERNYECMGITCQDVGGYWDATNSQYFQAAGPCTGAVDGIVSIAGYMPRSPVLSEARIDLDQDAIESNVGRETIEGFHDARRVYRLGGHAKAFATLMLTSPLSTALSAGALLEGVSDTGSLVIGRLSMAAPAQTSTIVVEYVSRDCEVGGLVGIAQRLGGCFSSSGVLLAENGETFGYTYEVVTGNENGVTIQHFSTTADDRMRQCPIRCPYPEFDLFLNYYGFSDYANRWILAALDGTATVLANGNEDFSLGVGSDLDLRSEIVRKGTVYMNIWMYVIYQFESSLDECQENCIDCNDNSVRAWDLGVAYYTGSMVGTEPNSVVRGTLLYTLANRICVQFKTCGTNGDSTEGNSLVNRRLFSLFHQGQSQLENGLCSDATKIKDDIVKLMRIPLVQATLRYAYTIGPFGNREPGELGNAAAFAATVLPILQTCGAQDSVNVYQNMGLQASSTDHGLVKLSLEANYGCMGITCADIGGYWDAANIEYFPGAEPCIDLHPTPSPTPPPTPLSTPAPTSAGSASSLCKVFFIFSGVLGWLLLY